MIECPRCGTMLTVPEGEEDEADLPFGEAVDGGTGGKVPPPKWKRAAKPQRSKFHKPSSQEKQLARQREQEKKRPPLPASTRRTLEILGGLVLTPLGAVLFWASVEEIVISGIITSAFLCIGGIGLLYAGVTGRQLDDKPQ